MANNASEESFRWESAGQHSRPPLAHRISSISEISLPGSPELGIASHRSSIVSLMTPIDGPKSSNESIDVCHVRLSSAEDFGTVDPVEGSSSRLSAALPGSLQIGTSVSPSSRAFNPFSPRTPGGKYAPVSPAEPPPENTARKSSFRRPNSKRFSSKRRVSIVTDNPILEEVDMGLLKSAAPFSTTKTHYRSLSEENDELQALSPMGTSFDLSSFTGPMIPQNEAQLQELHRQEAQGILTGGLGAGLRPDTTLKSGDLFATAPGTPTTAVSRRLSRTMSRRVSSRVTGLGRASTIRDLGQSEANKRGEIIEVIIEDPPVDISSFGGGSAPSDFDPDEGSKRKSTFKSANVEVFYPQANWKPFSMRWPYLIGLIISSVVLAAAQEYLYKKSTVAPLYKFNKPSELKTWDYFSFKYLPTLIAVAFGVLWQITDFEVKRLEAYYQLSKEGGALAAESINVDYITFFNFLRPFRALQFKHYAVAVSSVATLVAVSLVPTLQSASIILSPSRADREKYPLMQKEITMSGTYSRLLSVVLIILACLGCVLLWQLQTRRSGLVADVKGIAGIAAMANRSHILMDFKDMDTATPEIIHQKLKLHRYTLRNSSLAPDDQHSLTQSEKDKYDEHPRHENPHPLMLRLVAGIPLIVGMLWYMALLPIILFTAANIITDKAPWFVTGLAVCIKLAWGTLETDVRMMEPFYILSNRHASPKVLTLDYSSMPFGWMPVQAFLNGHFLIGLVGLGSVLAEVLTVLAISFSGVAGLDFTHQPPKNSTGMPNMNGLPSNATTLSNAHDASEETLLSFWFSFAFAIFILTFLCLVAVLVYTRRRHPFLPRQPNTIASILAFIHQSKMLYDFVGTEKMNNDEMVQRLVGIGKTYGLGWFMGRDGETHCGVDEEELVSSYKHGDDARKGRLSHYFDYTMYY